MTAQPDPTANSSSPPRLTIELRDGSRVVGQSLDAQFKFHSTLLGDLKLDLKNIRAMEFVSTNSAKLTTTSGDTLTGWFATTQLRVSTGFGKVELPVNSIRRLSVSVMRSPEKARAGLVALWSGEGNGDDSVGGNNASVSSGITYAPGKVGRGFSFDGQENRIIIPNATELNFGDNQDFSISAWIQPQASSTTSGVMSIVDKRFEIYGIPFSPGYEFGLVNGRASALLVLAGSQHQYGFTSSGPDLRDGQFHQVMLTIRRNSPDGGHLYVDGESVLTFDTTQLAGDMTNDQPLRIGNHCNPGLNSFFKGIINQVAIYHHALTAVEVREDYAEGNKK